MRSKAPLKVDLRRKRTLTPKAKDGGVSEVATEQNARSTNARRASLAASPAWQDLLNTYLADVGEPMRARLLKIVRAYLRVARVEQEEPVQREAKEYMAFVKASEKLAKAINGIQNVAYVAESGRTRDRHGWDLRHLDWQARAILDDLKSAKTGGSNIRSFKTWPAAVKFGGGLGLTEGDCTLLANLCVPSVMLPPIERTIVSYEDNGRIETLTTENPVVRSPIATFDALGKLIAALCEQRAQKINKARGAASRQRLAARQKLIRILRKYWMAIGGTGEPNSQNSEFISFIVAVDAALPAFKTRSRNALVAALKILN